ncbi:hypothetical protein ENSA5_31270 [Enhygromyxa salina]|uniref:DoxX family protein n=1 Tax=Enhygromyxa salina TaxID=215803 RepID=A0A2S9XYF7_9BACT|nr:DoxX family protein [Enhygromyxa salina]PRP97894.1 hypothetical protein ENSA5_31270 [Enhygromyxa salina]
MTQRSKPVDIVLWLATIFVAMLFFTLGAYKLGDGMQAQFEEWGYPPGVDAGIGILEMAGAVGLLFKRTAGWSAVGLMVIMLGAAATHLWFYDGLGMIAPLGMLVVLGLIAWGRGLPVRTRAPSSPGTADARGQLRRIPHN